MDGGQVSANRMGDRTPIRLTDDDQPQFGRNSRGVFSSGGPSVYRQVTNGQPSGDKTSFWFHFQNVIFLDLGSDGQPSVS